MPSASLFGSQMFERVVLYYLLHPGASPHFRALQRHLGAGTRSLRAELRRLEERGLLRRDSRGRQTAYRAEPGHPGWEALRQMVRAFGDPAAVLREALSTVPGIDAAFVFGSSASGDTHAESDVDVFVLGEDIPRRELGRSTLESSAVIGREVNVVRYTRRQLAEDLARGNAFIRSIAQRPRRWITGSERILSEEVAP